MSFPDFHSFRERTHTRSEANYEAMSPVLNLKSYSAEVTVSENSFEKCRFMYQDILSVMSPSADSPIKEGELALSKTGLLAQGVIVIRDHSHGFSLVNNMF